MGLSEEDELLLKRLKDYLDSKDYFIEPYRDEDSPDIFRVPITTIVVTSTYNKNGFKELTSRYISAPETYDVDMSSIIVREGEIIEQILPVPHKINVIIGEVPDIKNSVEEIINETFESYTEMVLGYEHEDLEHLRWTEVYKQKILWRARHFLLHGN